MERKIAEKLEAHNQGFMKGLDLSKQKAKREERSEVRRKEQRSRMSRENRFKRDMRDGDWDDAAERSDLLATAAQLFPAAELSAQYESLISRLSSPSTASAEERLALLSLLRKFVTSSSEPAASLSPVSAQILLPFLSVADNPPQVIEEATHILSYLLSREEAEAVENNGIPVLLQVISQETKEAAEHAMWTIGELVSDSVERRDKAIEANAHGVIARFVQEAVAMSIPMTQVAAYALGQLLKNSPSPPFDVLQTCLPALQTLSNIDHLDTKAEALQAIANYSQWDAPVVNAVAEFGVVEFAMFCVREESLHLASPAIKIIGNIVEMDEGSTDQLLAHGLLDALEKWVDDQAWKTRKEVVWIISNVAAGSKQHVDALLAHSVFQKVMENLHDKQQCVRVESAWTCRHIALHGTAEHLEKLKSYNVISLMKKTLYDDPDTVLNTLLVMKKVYETRNLQEKRAMVELLQTDNSFYYITKLVEHRNQEVSKTAEILSEMMTGNEVVAEVLEAPAVYQFS